MRKRLHTLPEIKRGGSSACHTEQGTDYSAGIENPPVINPGVNFCSWYENNIYFDLPYVEEEQKIVVLKQYLR